jgi:hypothetical protein
MVPPKDPSKQHEDCDYQPVPAKRTFTIKARVKFTGRMHPLPYDLEEPEAPTQAPN